MGGNLNFASSTTFNLDFSLGNTSSVDWDNSFWDLYNIHEWLVYDVSGTTSGFGNLMLDSTPGLDGTGDGFDPGTNVPTSANFALVQRGSQIYLRYEALPEPTTLGLLGLVLGALTGVVRPKRRLKRA